MNTLRILTSITGLVVASTAYAAPVLFDFSTVGTAPTTGGTWNSVAGPNSGVTQSGFVESTNASSAVTLNFSTGWQASTSAQPISGWNGGADKSWVDADVVADYFWHTATVSVTIGGLTPSGLYDIELVSVRSTVGNGSGSRNGTYTVAGATTSTDVSSSNYNAFGTGYTSAAPILKWDDVTASGSGTIVVSLAPNTNHTVFLNALKITAVPEPTSLALLGVGGLALGRRRR
jgi:hypothetical protein